MAAAAFVTIGHSTRSIEAFVALLRAHGVRVLADVRSIPRSRHNPQFSKDELGAALAAERIRYVHLPQLGGLRHPRADSPNRAWRNASFRGYADYMQTDSFREALDGLIALQRQGPVAIMCAEAVPWRCHRSLIADALLARGLSVAEIIGQDELRPHQLTSFARIDGDRVLYPAAES